MVRTRMVRIRGAGMAAALLVLAAACGSDGPDASGDGIATPAGTPESPRTIEVAMVDIAFEPTALSIQAGETVKFVFTNEGDVRRRGRAGGTRHRNARGGGNGHGRSRGWPR